MLPPFCLDHVLNQLNKQTFRTHTLYLVSLPIGNSADITVRALQVLALVDCIAAEDTRHTKPLLDLYGITSNKLMSLHQHNERLYTMICIEGQCSYMLICCVKVIRLVIRSFYNHH